MASQQYDPQQYDEEEVFGDGMDFGVQASAPYQGYNEAESGELRFVEQSGVEPDERETVWKLGEKKNASFALR